MRTRLQAVIGIGLATLMVACGGSSTPASPSTQSVTETLTGTLVSNTSKTHTFTAGPGSLSVTLTSLSPVTGIPIGLGFGTWDGSACTVGAVNENVQNGGGLLVDVKSSSTVCIKVYDVGYIGAGAVYTYTVTAVHY